MEGEGLAVLIGVGFLHVFFRAIESQWPASYFALTSGPDYAITRTLGRYVAFRLLPVLVVAVFAAVTLGRTGDAVVVPVALIGAVHAGVTSGRALVGLVPLVRGSPSFWYFAWPIALSRFDSVSASARLGELVLPCPARTVVGIVTEVAEPQ